MKTTASLAAATWCSVLLLSNIAVADPAGGATRHKTACNARHTLAGGDVQDGYYVGKEPMATPAGADEGRWFHEVTVTIADGHVSTAELPIAYADGERHESVSDGGFYYFDGCLVAETDHYAAEMHLTKSDYGDPRMKKTKTLILKQAEGGLLVNGKRYKRVTNPRRW